MQGPGPQSSMFCDRNLQSYLWVSPTPSESARLRRGSCYPSPLLSWPIAVSSCWALFPIVQFPKGIFWAQSPFIALLAKSFTSSQHWRMKTLHGYTMSFIPWPQIAFPKSPPPRSWAPVTLNFLLWCTLLSPSGSSCPLTAVRVMPSSPFPPGEILLISVSPSSYDVLPITHTHPG